MKVEISADSGVFFFFGTSGEIAVRCPAAGPADIGDNDDAHR